MSTGVVAVLLLGLGTLALRVVSVKVPTERLPGQVRTALQQVAPAVLGAFVVVGSVDALRTDTSVVRLGVLTALALVALLVRRSGSTGLAIGLAIVLVALLDLV